MLQITQKQDPLQDIFLPFFHVITLDIIHSSENMLKYISIKILHNGKHSSHSFIFDLMAPKYSYRMYGS